MRLLTGKRIGQSDNEFTTAVFFSLFLHVILFGGIFYLSLQIRQRIFEPPSYWVNLVALSTDSPQPMTTSPGAPPVAAPAQQIKSKVKTKTPPVKSKSTLRAAAVRNASSAKASMPELDAERKSTAPQQEVGGRHQEAVSVQAPAEFAPGSVFEWYSNNVRMKIKANWTYEYAPKSASVTVVFSILRSGLVQDVKLERASGIFSYDQAAIRAIRLSSPFPALPEDFLKPSVVFSVDLQPEE